MSHHTPGPWLHMAFSASVPALDLPVRHIVAPVGERPVCAVASRGTALESFANAALVAAAPELLEAIKSLRDHAYYMAEMTGIPVPTGLVAVFESAIAKAGGVEA